MNIPSPRAKRHARIEIVPLIDVVFFLLATFIVVSLSMVKSSGVAVQLPTAATGTPEDHRGSVTITVTDKGDVFFNKEVLRIDQLAARAQRLKMEQVDPRVFIHGDEKAFFGAAVAVLDALRLNGITKVSIETRK